MTGKAAGGVAALQPVCCTFHSVSEPQTWKYTLRSISQQTVVGDVVVIISLCCVDILRKITKSRVLKKPQKMYYRILKGKRNTKYSLYALISYA